MEEAVRLGHSYVGSEHLLLGVAQQDDGAALASLGVTPERMRAQVVRLFGRGDAEAAGPRSVPLTPHAKSALEWAFRASVIFGRKTIEPQHILIALVIEEGGGALRILHECDVGAEDIRRAILRELGA